MKFNYSSLLFQIIVFIISSLIISGCSATFLEASKNGDMKAIQKLLTQKNTGINEKNKNGDTPLMTACLYENSDIAAILIKQGADIHHRSNDGNTALSFAAGTGELKTVKLLLAKGAVVDSKDNYGVTPLMLSTGYLGAWTKRVLSMKVNISEALFNQGNIEVIKKLLKAGADINLHSDFDGNTPLIFACMQLARPDIVAFLLENGADVNAKNASGDTALIFAVRGQFHDTSSKTTYKLTPKHLRVISILLKNGADVDIKNNKGETALIIAKKKWIEQMHNNEYIEQNKECIESLIEMGLR